MREAGRQAGGLGKRWASLQIHGCSGAEGRGREHALLLRGASKAHALG
jgi:hypothetical protein